MIGDFPFTIVIPVYNRAQMLKECLDPFLHPECRGLQLIVVDDGSTDGSAEVAEQLAAESQGAVIRVVRQENAGPGAARNAGAALVSTEWIAFLDSDDCWFPGTAPLIARFLEAHGDAGLVFLKMYESVVTPDTRLHPDEVVHFRTHNRFIDLLRHPRRIHIGACNMLIRSSAFHATGGFATDIFYSEDTHLLWRVPREMRILEITAPELMHYRLHDDERLTRVGMRVRDGVSRVMQDIGRGQIGRSDPEAAAVIAERGMFLVRKLFLQGHLVVPMAILLDGLPLFYRHYGAYRVVRTLAMPLLVRLGIEKRAGKAESRDPA